jgi:hypothetical protein
LTRGLGPICLVAAEGDRYVIRFAHGRGLRHEFAALSRETDRRERPLADYYRMDELDRNVPRVGTRDWRGAERDQPATAREPLCHAVAAARDPLGFGFEERLV